jgi:hypothetical protein
VAYRVIIRHQQEKTMVDGRRYDRHAITFRQELGDGSTENPYNNRENTVVARHLSGDTPADVEDFIQSILYWGATSTNMLKVVGWES